MTPEVPDELLIVGQVIVDVVRPVDPEGGLRLGGVVHAARMAWALEVPYSVAFIAPTYLTAATIDYLGTIGCRAATQIGVVNGAPNVILIPEPTEAGPQGYEMLMHESRFVELDNDRAKEAGFSTTGDILLFPDETDVALLGAAFEAHSERCVVDTSVAIERLTAFVPGTFVTSASPSRCSTGTPSQLAAAALGAGFATALVKENRGGSRLWVGADVVDAGAVIGPIVHSVGVGDAFDVAWLTYRHRGDAAALTIASQMAWVYASTTNPDVLKDLVDSSRVLDPELVNEGVIRLPWERRPETVVYLAAPDFDWVDTSAIDAVDQALRYHNFTSRRPVRENGQVEPETDGPARLREVFNADMRLLEEATILVAVLINDDPGTVAEIGWAASREVPTILFDPHRRAKNLMLTHLPDALVHDLDGVIQFVYRHAVR